jgi:predicted Holliday junction resolvase-like endonuclease
LNNLHIREDDLHDDEKIRDKEDENQEEKVETSRSIIITRGDYYETNI